MTPWFTKINKYNYNGEPCYLWYNGIQHHQLYDVCHKNKTVNYDDAPLVGIKYHIIIMRDTLWHIKNTRIDYSDILSPQTCVMYQSV